MTRRAKTAGATISSAPPMPPAPPSRPSARPARSAAPRGSSSPWPACRSAAPPPAPPPGVSKDTIEKARAAARRAVIGGLQPSRIHEVVADCMAAYLHVREMALHDATVARPAPLERGKALDNALRANIAVVRFCQDMRLMPKAPIDLALAIKDHPALKALAPEELPRFFKGVTRTLIALGEPSAVDQVRALAAALNGGEEVEGEGAEEGGAWGRTTGRRRPR